MSSRGFRAFTLIELLTVIGVVAILAGLILPTVSIAKERASRTHCKNNLRQLNVAVRIHADENLGRMPFTWMDASMRWNNKDLKS